MTPLSIVILGGGTAGWMAACLLAKAWPHVRVTVVESPEIGIVGVGEGSTPQLRHFFATLGIAERDWMPACDATYKLGIAFHGWSDAPGYERYFHPFASDVDPHTEPAFHAAHHARRTLTDVPAHPDAFFLNTRLAREGRGPVAGEAFPFEAAYGYHFDAHKVGAVLREHAVSRGVVHVARRVIDVAVGEDGDVRHLAFEGGGKIAGDVFFDSSGFRSVIAQQALGVRFLPFAENLFNDRAVVIPTPAGDAIEPFTTATALANGWAWRIPLTSRTGNGYVYASAYCDADGAERALRAHLGVGDDVPARHLSMKVGQVEATWRGNCLAIGLAQGFIEPLEATALHLVQATVEGFIERFAAGGFTPAQRDAFNAGIARRYEGVRDYIVAHYRMNQRGDTRYWRDARGDDRLSASLKRVMTCWFTGGDLAAEIAAQDIGRYYAPLSWGCLFAGYGTFPDAARMRAGAVGDDGVEEFLRRCALNFTPHEDCLRSVRPSTSSGRTGMRGRTSMRHGGT